MEFVVIAYDGQDEGALQRRLAVRDQHMAMVKTLQAQGHMIHGGAILNDEQQMIGSIVICDFPSREALDWWIQEDPYVKGNVWQDIQVLPFKTAPPFFCNLPSTPSATA